MTERNTRLFTVAIVALVVIGSGTAMAFTSAANERGGTLEAQETTVAQETTQGQQQPAVTVRNQTGDGSTVTVQSATLPNGGFVAIYDEGGYIGGQLLGVSDYLSAGTQQDIVVQLNQSLSSDATVTAVIHTDSDSNQTFDYDPNNPSADLPYLVGNDPVSDTAQVTVSAGQATTQIGTTVATTQVGTTQAATEVEPTQATTEADVTQATTQAVTTQADVAGERTEVGTTEAVTEVDGAEATTEPAVTEVEPTEATTEAATEIEPTQATTEAVTTQAATEVEPTQATTEADVTQATTQAVTTQADVAGERTEVGTTQAVTEVGTTQAVTTRATTRAATTQAATTQAAREPGQVASINFEDQSADGRTITVQSVTVPNGGFVAIHDSRILRGQGPSIQQARGRAAQSVVATSRYLSPGTHRNVEIRLSQRQVRQLRRGQGNQGLNSLVVAAAYRDTDGDSQFRYYETNGRVDRPYTRPSGDFVFEAALIEFGGNQSAMEASRANLRIAN